MKIFSSNVHRYTLKRSHHSFGINLKVYTVLDCIDDTCQCRFFFILSPGDNRFLDSRLLPIHIPVYSIERLYNAYLWPLWIPFGRPWMIYKTKSLPINGFGPNNFNHFRASPPAQILIAQKIIPEAPAQANKGAKHCWFRDFFTTTRRQPYRTSVFSAGSPIVVRIYIISKSVSHQQLTDIWDLLYQEERASGQHTLNPGNLSPSVRKLVY